MMENTPASLRKPRKQRSRGSHSSRRKSYDRSPKRSSRHGKKSETPLEAEATGTNRHPPNAFAYDFSVQNISNSQSLFESRLDAASPPTRLSSASTVSSISRQLDQDVLCSPQDFTLQWSNLRDGTKISCKVEGSMPSLSNCHKHFRQQRFYVIASGVVGCETKLFLVAQRRGVNSVNKTPRTTMTRCFCEIIFDSDQKKVTVELRCSDKSLTSFFMSALALKELI